MKRFFKAGLLFCLVFIYRDTFAGHKYEDTTSYVSIDYIRGAKIASGNQLDWKVSCFSTPSVTIAIERSTDGIVFTALEEQFATATRCQQPFSFTDLAPQPGLNYYRVKTTDIDGSKTYSFTVPIVNADKGLVVGKIMPNPVQSTGVLQVSSAKKSMITIIISSLSGHQVRRQKYALVAGSNEIHLYVGKIAAGSYHLTLITAEGETRSLRLVKQ